MSLKNELGFCVSIGNPAALLEADKVIKVDTCCLITDLSNNAVHRHYLAQAVTENNETRYEMLKRTSHHVNADYIAKKNAMGAAMEDFEIFGTWYCLEKAYPVSREFIDDQLLEHEESFCTIDQYVFENRTVSVVHRDTEHEIPGVRYQVNVVTETKTKKHLTTGIVVDLIAISNYFDKIEHTTELSEIVIKITALPIQPKEEIYFRCSHGTNFMFRSLWA